MTDPFPHPWQYRRARRARWRWKLVGVAVVFLAACAFWTLFYVLLKAITR